MRPGGFPIRPRGLTGPLPASLLLGLFLATSPVRAGEVLQVTPFGFGTIDLHPGGDTIVIAAENGSAAPLAGRSTVTGGTSGMITLTSTDAEHVEIVYPETVVLTSGGRQLTIRDIAAHSQYAGTGVDLLGGNIQVNVHVGGSLTLSGNEVAGNYSGSMLIEINYF